MASIFFYIGLPKTATTWLQEEVLPSIDGIEVRVPANWEEIDLRTDGKRDLVICARWMSASVSDRKRPGYGSWILAKSMDFISTQAPEARIIVGFREHESWLRAGFSQKAKRRQNLDAGRYATTFAPNDLYWCVKLETVEASCRAVFPFLFEEIMESPERLVNDLCGFLGRDPPKNLETLSQIHRNPSPRSGMGLDFSRSLSKLSHNKRWRETSSRVGTWIDRYFPVRQVELDPKLAGDLRQDWNRLVGLVGNARHRDLTRFTQDEREVVGSG